jgi:hypothetical protein
VTNTSNDFPSSLPGLTRQSMGPSGSPKRFGWRHFGMDARVEPAHDE